MSKINEVIDSLNNENADEIKKTLKSEASDLLDKNTQLYQRAKKAEGFEFNKETKEWAKKEPKVEPEKKPKTTETEKPGEFDYGQKVFISKELGVKINNPEQLKLVNDYLANGKQLDDLVDNKYFNNDLKDIKDNQDAKAATPDGTKGAGSGSTRDSVDYYLSKGEMPPADKPELRKEYVNAKYKKEKNVSHFAN